MSYRFTTDQSEMDLSVIHNYLTQSYWSPGIPKHTVAKAMQGSFCFALMSGDTQVAFGRFVTDQATFAYLADVFVLEAHRGQGLSKRMISEAMERPELQGLRRMMLVTSDAHGLYRQLGFSELSAPEKMMEYLDADIYRKTEHAG